MRERALLFGDTKSLVGIITEPAAGNVAGERPAVVLLNAGVLHRVGPNRLYVRLARRLAESGFVVARFDYSGIGDSRARADGMPFARSTIAEARECMDMLAASGGARGFLLAGLCSGADNALRVACEDPRVVGAGLLEPHAIPTAGSVVHSYRRRLLDPRSWLRLLGGRSELWTLLKERRTAARESAPVAAPASEAGSDAGSDGLVPSEAEFAAQVRRLAQRGTDLCFVYSAGNPAYYHYRMLLHSALEAARARGTTSVAVLAETDHAFTPLDTQEKVLQIVCEWAKKVAAATWGTALVAR